MSVRIWLTVIFYLIVKYVEATENDLKIQEYNGWCIKTVEGLIDTFNTGLNTSHSATHSGSDSLLDMSARQIQTKSLIIIRFNTTTSETRSTSLRNNTNTCCHPAWTTRMHLIYHCHCQEAHFGYSSTYSPICTRSTDYQNNCRWSLPTAYSKFRRHVLLDTTCILSQCE